MNAKALCRATSILLGLLVLASGAVTPMRASAEDEHSFAAEADAEVIETKPAENFGSESKLHADESPATESVVRFAVDGLSGTVESATLRLYVTDGSSDGPDVYAIDLDWAEDVITWETRPETQGSVLDHKVKVGTGWVEYDVTSAVGGDGTYAFKLVPNSDDGTTFNSREASRHDPELVVETGEAPAPEPTPVPDGAPNVLIIMSDDQRPDTLEVMDRTRHWLGEGGTTFDQGFATTPLCCPSRATFFSGRYMHNHGVLDNGEFHKNLDQRYTLPRYLQDAGYQTAMVGKFAPHWPRKNPPPHFDQFALSSGGYVNATYNVDGKSKKAPYTTDFLRDQAIEFLDGFEDTDARPWFLYLAPQAPHDDEKGEFPPAARHKKAPVPEFEPAPSHPETDKSDKPSFLRKKKQSESTSKKAHDGQLRTLLALDEAIDAVFERLEESGELDNTLVIYTSDNGYHWGEHGVNSKGLPYSESVRVPFMVRWPGHVDEGVTDHRLVAGIDVLPTVLDAANLSPTLGYPLDGRSLLASGARNKILLEFGAGHRGYPSWASLRTHDDQYIEWYGKDDETVTFREYYDLQADPYQLDNLLADDEDGNDPDVDGLSAELKRHRACEGSTGSAACP